MFYLEALQYRILKSKKITICHDVGRGIQYNNFRAIFCVRKMDLLNVHTRSKTLNSWCDKIWLLMMLQW